MVHGNFYRDRSTTDLLKNHIGHRPLESRPSQLANTLCLNENAQRPRTVLLQEDGTLCLTCQNGGALQTFAGCELYHEDTANLITGYIPETSKQRILLATRHIQLIIYRQVNSSLLRISYQVTSNPRTREISS